MKNSCGSLKHMRAVDGKQNQQFHWPNDQRHNLLYTYCTYTPNRNTIFITYLLVPRETVIFVALRPEFNNRGQKNHCFPEVPVNK